MCGELSSISGDFIYPAASLGGDLLVLINNNSNGKQLGQAYYKLSSQGSPVPFGEACADGCWQPFITKSYLFWQNMPSGVFRTQRANLSKQDFVAASQGLYGLIAEEDDTAYLIGAKEGDGYPVLRIKSGGAPEKLAQLSKPLYGVKVVDGFLYLMDPIDPPTLFRVQTKD